MASKDVNAAVLAAAAQINPMIAAAAAIIQAVRGIRNSVAAAAPQLLEDGTLAKTDKELISQFAEKAGLLKTESAELVDWLEQQHPPGQ